MIRYSRTRLPRTLLAMGLIVSLSLVTLVLLACPAMATRLSECSAQPKLKCLLSCTNAGHITGATQVSDARNIPPLDPLSAARARYNAALAVLVTNTQDATAYRTAYLEFQSARETLAKISDETAQAF